MLTFQVGGGGGCTEELEALKDPNEVNVLNITASEYLNISLISKSLDSELTEFSIVTIS